MGSRVTDVAHHTFGATFDGQKLDRVQLDFIFVARENKQLAVTISGARYVRVPMLGVEEDSICLTTQLRKRVEEKDGMAECRTVRCIQAVRIVGPVRYAIC